MKSLYESYAEVGTTSELMSASPHRLIQLLLEKCVAEIQLAKTHIQQSRFDQKRYAIQQASQIISHLRDCLNHEDDALKQMSSLLDENYDWIIKFLLIATAKNEIEPLERAEKMMTLIKEGWDGIAV